jgi:hypothetical protein
MTVKASEVEGSVKKAKNGRYYVLLKVGGSRMLSDDDAKRLRGELGKRGTTTKRKSGGSKSNPGSTPRKTRTKKYLGDFL